MMSQPLNFVCGRRAVRGLTLPALALAGDKVQPRPGFHLPRHMAEIKNYTLNFACRRRAVRGLACAARKLAGNEIDRDRETAD
jgi:hypothetical protein